MSARKSDHLNRISSLIRRSIVLGGGIILIALIMWVGGRTELNQWGAGALSLLISALIAASIYNDLRNSQRHRGQVDESDMPLMPPADTVLANIPDPIILIDRRMIVFEINTIAQELFPALRTGLPLSFSLRNPDVLGGINQVLQTGKPINIHYSERLPTERAFELQISLLRGSEQWVLLFFRDITTAHRLEKMRVDFIANVSHELRTPLASVIGFIETIQGPAQNDAIAREKFLGVMLTQSRRMSRLIDDLLSLSRIELHGHVAPETELDLESTVRQIIPTLSPLAKEQNLEITFTTEGGPFLIKGDRDEMLRVLENLLENAIKYGSDGGKIDVTLGTRPKGKEPAHVELVVRDYGAGIAPEHLPRLTERFYRTDTETSRRKGGTGLGLAIVKHIVLRHRGQFSIESELGQGSQFKITLPAKPNIP